MLLRFARAGSGAGLRCDRCCKSGPTTAAEPGVERVDAVAGGARPLKRQTATATESVAGGIVVFARDALHRAARLLDPIASRDATQSHRLIPIQATPSVVCR